MITLFSSTVKRNQDLHKFSALLHKYNYLVKMMILPYKKVHFFVNPHGRGVL